MFLDQDFVVDLLAKTATIPLPAPTSTPTPTALPTVVPTLPSVYYEVAGGTGKTTLWLVNGNCSQ